MPRRKKPKRAPHQPPSTGERRSEHDLRVLVQKAIREAIAKHDARHQRMSWLSTLVGLGCVAAGIFIFLNAHHDHAEWVAIVLIVLGGALFDRKAVTGILRARFGGRNNSTGEYGVRETGGA